MKIMSSGDWELTEKRLEIAEKICNSIVEEFNTGEYDLFVFAGDMFREYTAKTIHFVRSIIRHLEGVDGWKPILLVGNHDREIEIDRLTAIFSGEMRVINVPSVIPFNNTNLAFLPAPDRAAFGATREAEGRRRRDTALSEAMEAALISLEAEIGEISQSILFFHASIGGAELGKQKLPHGLTWEIPEARLARWGLAIGGHIHKPQKIGEGIYYTGTIAPWTFSDKAERFRVIAIEPFKHTVGLSFSVDSISLPRVLLPIEIEFEHALSPNCLSAGDTLYPMHEFEGQYSWISKLEFYLKNFASLNLETDSVNIKIRAKLPPTDLEQLPKSEEFKTLINERIRPGFINELSILKEPTGLHKARLSEDAKELALPELFDRYLEIPEVETDQDTAARAKDKIADIEQIYRPGEGNFGFSPIKIKLRNFRQWEEAEIDFRKLEGAVSITGNNTLGKTNLLEAVIFALFKRSPASDQSLEEELKNGTSEGSVELWFKTNGKEYLVRRALELKKTVSCKSEFFTIEMVPDEESRPGHYEPIPVCETANEIDKEIEKLVGSYNFVISTFFGAQKGAVRLVEATPSQWHKLLLEALDLGRFEPMRKYASDTAEALKTTIERTETRIDELEQQLTVDQAELEDLESAEDLESKIKDQKALISGYESSIEALRRKKDKLLEEKVEIQAKQREQESIRTRKGSIERQLQEIKIEDIGERPAELSVVGDIDAKKMEFKQLEIEREDLSPESIEYKGKIAELEGEIKSIERQIAGSKGRFDQNKQSIAALEKKLQELEEPPCDDFGLPAKGLAPIKERCEAWQIYTQGDHITELKERNQKVDEEIENHKAVLKQKKDELSGIEASKEKTDERLNQVNTELAALSKLIGDYENAQKAIELWEAKARTQETLKKQQANLKNERQELIKKFESFEDLGKKIVEINNSISTNNRKIESDEAKIKEVSAGIQELQYQFEKIKNLQEGIEKKKAKQEEYRNEIKQQQFDVKAWSLLAHAFHHTGIPYLLLEQMAGAFEHEANKLLEFTDLSVSIETVTPTKKGEARDKMSVRFNDSRGQHSLTRSSGYQSEILDMILSASMAAVGARFWGAVPEIYIQDEGWGSFHHSNYDIARELIGTIAQRFTRFFYITHVEALADSADIRLQVVSENGTSKVIQ